MTEGNGSYSLTRWYFDINSKSCKQFYYKGSGGNQVCLVREQPDCIIFFKFPLIRLQQKKTVILQKNSTIKRWRSILEPFQNSFLTEESCQRACPSFANPCSSGEPILVDGSPKVCSPDDRCPQTHYCHLEADELHGYCCPKGKYNEAIKSFFQKICCAFRSKSLFFGRVKKFFFGIVEGNPCDLPMIRGEGLSVVPRFYYDKKTHRCREFAYRGSKGNANNFLTLSDCESMCPCKLSRIDNKSHKMVLTWISQLVVNGAVASA